MLRDKRRAIRCALASAVVTLSAGIIGGATAAQPTSYMSVNITEDFATTLQRMRAAKSAIEKRQQDLLEQRYDLGNHPARGVTMSGGKVIQEGVRIKLPAGVTWDSLASMRFAPRECFPRASCPCHTRIIPKAGWCFQSFTSRRSSGRRTVT
jgi:hypothetical protein